MFCAVVKTLTSMMGRTCSSVGGSGTCVHNLCLLHLVYIRVICYGHIVTNMCLWTVWYSFKLYFATWCSLYTVSLHDGCVELTHVVGSCMGQV